jgi:DNA replication ATP-dependent helicase Dna2
MGTLLLARIEEVLNDTQLGPKEKIPKYRSILEDLFKALTADAFQYINGLLARTSYVFKEYDVPKNIIDCTNGLRIHANKVVHESDFIPGHLDEQRCVYQLAEVVAYFSKLNIPATISAYYEPAMEEIKQSTVFIPLPVDTYHFFAVIEDIFLPSGEAEGKFCILICNTDTLGKIKLKLNNNKNENDFGTDLAAFGKIAQRYQNIYVTDVKRHPEKPDEYSSTYKSCVILEPDYLIDVKELSECRQHNRQVFGRYIDNPLLYLLSRFSKYQFNDKLVVGNIVGRMLDDMVTQQSFDYKSSFEVVMRENSFGMLCIANVNGKYDREMINKVYIQAGEHEKQLRHVLSNYQNKQIILEPTFISNKYGLQGRLDILIDYGENNNRKDIIELKSSTNYPDPSFGVYMNHEAQTICYDLLLSSTYPDRVGYNAILYSKAPIQEKPLRNVSIDDREKTFSKQDLLMLRNRIVANDFKLARGIFDPFFEILSENFGPYPKYLEDEVNDFRDTIAGLDETLKQYFLGFLKFIYTELQVAKIGRNDAYSKSNGYAELWKASISEKRENYDVLIYLKIKAIEDADHFYITLTVDRNLFSYDVNVSSFRVGDTAILYPTTNPEELHPLKSQILKCYVVSVDKEVIKVSLINKQVNKTYFNPKLYWVLDRDFRESSYKQLLNLLYEFIKSDKRVIDLVLGLKRPEFNKEVTILPNQLDPSQAENVRKAVSAKDYYIIQGPPGTGKTSKVLVEIIRNIANPQAAVLVVAYTNRAVDEICEKLMQLNLSCIRLGKGDKPYYWSSLAGKLKLNELYDKVKDTHIFVSTISTFAGSLDILRLKQFETLIIDEASQVIEPQIVGFLKYFQRWILIGDENQLPAIVLQSVTDSRCTDKALNALSLMNFRESLFYRLKRNAIQKSWNDCFGQLTYQYRMHADIAAFPKKAFYANNLQEGTNSQNNPIPGYQAFNDNPINVLLTKSRVVFIPSEVSLNARVNHEEAELVIAILKHIRAVFGAAFNPAETVGVITPFRAQIANIRNLLPDQLQSVTIDTVERFQGSERDIIIVSFAVKSVSQLAAIQSINDQGIDRKLNVTLTRAKEHLILIGSETVLSKDKTYKELLAFIKSKNGYQLNPLKLKLVPTDLF